MVIENARAYLITRLNVLDKEIAVREKEYRQIVEILLRKEKEMEEQKEIETKYCTLCKRNLPITSYDLKPNGERKKTCAKCLKKAEERRNQFGSLVRTDLVKKKKKEKINLEKETAKIHKLGLSYAEYQKQETLRMLREGK